jgi:hypothetical protein
VREYPHIERHIRRVGTAPHGLKTKRVERLKRARLATLKRELGLSSTRRARGGGR